MKSNDIVVCIDDKPEIGRLLSDSPCLTFGKRYKIESTDFYFGGIGVYVLDDNGCERHYNSKRFIELSDLKRIDLSSM